MEIFTQLVFLAIGFVMLVKGADWFVDGSAAIAVKFKIPQLVIGLTIVAMGTSAPEAAVSIAAALKGNAEITVGNIVGSNILNILIILGLCTFFTALSVAKSTIKTDIPIMIAATLLLLIMGFNGTIGRLSGIVLLVVFIAYLAYLFIVTKKNGDTIQDIEIKPMKTPKALLLTAIGIALVVCGSNVTVDAAIVIAKILGLGERFIALTIVAFGTSLPELFTSVSAARKGNADIAIGNIVGSNIFNILFIVGLSASITPVLFTSSFRFDTIIAIYAAVLLLVCSLRKRKLTKWAGIAMLISYAAYFAVIFR